MLIADKRLKKSMPELVHMNNCLLSSNQTQMLDNIDVAINNYKLREFIGIKCKKYIRRKLESRESLAENYLNYEQISTYW